MIIIVFILGGDESVKHRTSAHSVAVTFWNLNHHYLLTELPAAIYVILEWIRSTLPPAYLISFYHPNSSNRNSEK